MTAHHLDETLDKLLLMAAPRTLRLAQDSEQFVLEQRFGLGIYARNLYLTGTPLAAWLAGRGIYDPEDQIDFLLDAFQRAVRDRPQNWDALIEAHAALAEEEPTIPGSVRVVQLDSGERA